MLLSRSARFDQRQAFAAPMTDAGDDHLRERAGQRLLAVPTRPHGGNRLPWLSASAASATFIGNCGSMPCPI